MFPAAFINGIDLRYHIARRSGRVTFKIGLLIDLDPRKFFVKGSPRYFTFFERGISESHVTQHMWQVTCFEEFRPQIYIWQFKYKRGYEKISDIKLRKRTKYVPS